MAWPHAVTTTTTFFLDTKTTVVIKQIDLEYRDIEICEEMAGWKGEEGPSKGLNLRIQIWWGREGLHPEGEPSLDDPQSRSSRSNSP